MKNKYPREINMDEETEARLRSYIDDELRRHYAERGEYIDNIKSWQIDYWAEPSSTEATFPYRGAATIIVPLAAITVEAIHSRVMTTMFALNQFVAARPKSPRWTDYARPVEMFIDMELLHNVGIKRPLNDSILEIIKYGTGVAKTGWEYIEKTAVRNVGSEEKEVTVIIKNNATVDSVPIGSFLMPLIYQDPQTSAWCGEEHVFTPYELRLLETAGKFKEGTVEKLSAHFSTNPHTTANSGISITEGQEDLEGREPVWPDRLNCVELWLGFDIDGTEDSIVNGFIPREAIGNSFDKEIVVHYHQDTGTFLSVRYNWHEDLRRPYYTGVYFPVEHRWPGIGVCKQVEQFQKEITTQHRQRIDNATLANCRMIKVNNLSKYGPDEPIFPGKMWFVDNKDDIETFQLGEIYPSSFSNENQSLLYIQQRTGVNEVNLGMPQAGTPGTATSDLARIQEGNKKFDYTYRNIKDFANEVTKSTILNIKQFGPRAEIYYETVENGAMVKEFFQQDFELIKQGLCLEFSVAGQQDNKLLDRNNWTQVAQFLTQYYNEMTQLAQGMGDQQLLQRIMANGMVAATETIKQILESFDIKNVDRIIVQEALHNGQLGQLASGNGAVGGSQNVSPPAGMGNTANSIPQSRNSVPQIAPGVR